MITVFKHSHGDILGFPEFEVEHKTYGSLDVHDMMQAFRSFLLGIGYAPESVSEYIGEP